MSYSKYLSQVNKFRCKYKGKKIANNTRMYMDKETESIYIKHHNTDILEFTKDGKTIINLCGYNTVTTLARIREYSNTWLTSREIEGLPYNAFKPITLLADGTIDFTTNEGILEELKKEFCVLVQKQNSKLFKPVHQDKIDKIKVIIRKFGKPEISRHEVKKLRQDIKDDAQWYEKRKELKKIYHNNMVNGKIYVVEKNKAYYYDTVEGITDCRMLKQLDIKVKIDSRGLKKFKKALEETSKMTEVIYPYFDKNFVYKNSHVTVHVEGVYCNYADKFKEYLPLSRVALRKNDAWYNAEYMSIMQFNDIKHELVSYDIMDALTGAYNEV